MIMSKLNIGIILHVVVIQFISLIIDKKQTTTTSNSLFYIM